MISELEIRLSLDCKSDNRIALQTQCGIFTITLSGRQAFPSTSSSSSSVVLRNGEWIQSLNTMKSHICGWFDDAEEMTSLAQCRDAPEERKFEVCSKRGESSVKWTIFHGQSILPTMRDICLLPGEFINAPRQTRGIPHCIHWADDNG